MKRLFSFLAIWILLVSSVWGFDLERDRSWNFIDGNAVTRPGITSVLLPRMTTAERDAISPLTNSQMIYNTTTDRYNFYNGYNWVGFGESDIPSVPWRYGPIISTLNGTKVHWMEVWKGKLWIATGSGLNGTNKCVIYSYNIHTAAITSEYEVPAGYSGDPYWRILKVFKGNLYAGLGNNNNVAGTGDVWRYDGTTWSQVLNTTEYDIYSLEVYNDKLYAGGGSDTLGAGKLYVSSDGASWTLLKTFTADHVRSLKTWQGKLHIGLKINASLWSYDGSSFVDHGAPTEINNLKSLIPYRGKLYIGCVGPKVFSWDGSSFIQELDATGIDSEFYHGEVYAGCLWFPTNSATTGGRVWKYDGNAWTQDYVDANTTAQMQSLREYAGYLCVGGGKKTGYDLTLRCTKQTESGLGLQAINYLTNKIDSSGRINLKDIATDIENLTANPETTVDLKDDFIGGSLESGEIGELGWMSTAGTITNVGGDALTHPGTKNLDTSAVINTIIKLFIATAPSASQMSPEGNFDITFIIRPKTNTNQELRVGLSVDLGDAPPASGIYFLHDTNATSSETGGANPTTANWVCITRSGSISTLTNTGVACTADTWYKLRIRRISSSSIEFFINGVSVGIHSTNISNATMTTGINLENLEALSKTVDIDYFRLKIDGLSR